MKKNDSQITIRRATAMAIALFGASALTASASTFNLEIDYMVKSGVGGHTHKPSDAEIAAVVHMFACQGHTLNVVVSDAIPHFDNLIADPNNANSFFGYSGASNSFGSLRSTYFNHAGQAGWHYCIFCHNYEGSSSSGLAELPGANLVVSLGSFSGGIGTSFDRAATLAHEFGHNLGLTHCGNMDCGSTGTYVPIVPSIMTYFFQLQGVKTNLVCNGLALPEAALFKDIDYSHGGMCSLNENSLSELFGDGMLGVDWNCDGNIQGFGSVSHVIRGNESGWCGATGTHLALSDYDEWSNLNDVTLSKAADQFKDMPTVTCITAEEAEMHLRSSCAQPTLVTESCVNARMIYLRAAANPSPTGKCSSAYPTLTSAMASAPPSGSALFFATGTYNEPSVVTITTPMLLYSVGGGSTLIQH